MPTALIKLACQQIIDAAASTPFEQQVFNATYKEFQLQQQSFSKGLDLPTWSAIKEKFPKSNPALPFKVSFSIAGLLRSLDKKIPRLADTLNIRSISFVNHYFQLLDSNINDPSAHKVSIIYLTDTMTCLGTFGDSLLLACGDKRNAGASDNEPPVRSGQPAQTFLLKMEERLSIVSYEEWSRSPLEIFSPRPCALPDQASLFP
jgi:hypothetical protein